MEQSFEFLVSLWKNYNKASSLLTKAMGGTANEVGEFAEILATKYYKGKQLPASNKSADIKTQDGKLIQVKSRKIDKLTSTSLNVIRSWNFDILVVILFNKEGNILKAIEIDSKTAELLSTRNKYQNGKVLTTNHELINNPNTKDITRRLQNILDNKELGSEISSTTMGANHNKSSNAEISTRMSRTPIIEIFPDNVSVFKKELVKTQKAKRTWFFNKGTTKIEVWNASNFTEHSDLMANIKTNNKYRRWKELGIVKVRLEIIGESSG